MFGDQTYGSTLPTAKEYRVIELVAQGMKNGEVAEEIGTTEYMIKNYLRAIYDKLGLWNRVELALWYEARRHESAIRPLEAQDGPAPPPICLTSATVAR